MHGFHSLNRFESRFVFLDWKSWSYLNPDVLFHLACILRKNIPLEFIFNLRCIINTKDMLEN
jgi:hypothetical protein